MRDIGHELQPVMAALTIAARSLSRKLLDTAHDVPAAPDLPEQYVRTHAVPATALDGRHLLAGTVRSPASGRALVLVTR